MTSTPKGQPPGPILVASAGLYLLAGVLIIAGLWMSVSAGTPLFAAVFCFVALWLAAIALGLWRGRRGARVWALLFGAGFIGGPWSRPDPTLEPALVFTTVGVALIVLVTVPRSSRAWFRRQAVSPATNQTAPQQYSTSD